MTDDDEDMPFIALINPEIDAGRRAPTDEGWEGCLSIPDIRGKRAARVEQSACGPTTATGSASSSSASGLPARVIQHETDHLDGVLFFDRMRRFESLTFMDEFRRYWAKDDDEDDDERRRVDADRAPKRAALAPYFTNLDRPVFALVNLPETVKGALFARYSRSAKSLRRLFLDEFLDRRRRRRPRRRRSASTRAEKLYQRVFNEYGDDSVAQLGGVHLAVRGRVEHPDQGARVRPPDGVPRAVHALHALHRSARRTLALPRAGRARRPSAARSSTSRRWTRRSRPTRGGSIRCRRSSSARYPKAPADSDARLPRGDSREGARHAARPAAGGDAVERRHLRHRPGYEALLLRMRAHPLAEVRATAPTRCSTELRKVIPAFLTRVDQPDRGGRWSAVPRRHARARRSTLARAARRGVDAGAARRGDADRLRSRRRGEGRRRRALRVVGAARRRAAGDRAAR